MRDVFKCLGLRVSTNLKVDVGLDVGFQDR